MLLGPALKAMIVKGRLTVIDSNGKRHEFCGSAPGSSLTLHFHRHSLPIRLALPPDLALGEAYMDGSLTIENGDIFHAMAFLMDNAERSGGFRLRRWGRSLNFWMMRRLQQRNAIPAARRGAMSPITMIYPAVCTNCFWTPTGNTAALTTCPKTKA